MFVGQNQGCKYLTGDPIIFFANSSQAWMAMGPFCLLSKNTYNLGIFMEDAFLPKILELKNRT